MTNEFARVNFHSARTPYVEKTGIVPRVGINININALLVFIPYTLSAVRPRAELMFLQIRIIDFTSNLVSGFVSFSATYIRLELSVRTHHRVKSTISAKLGEW